MDKIFATAINCIDGRVQRPVIDYIKKNFNVDYVDMITEPGPNKILADNSDPLLIESIRKRVEVSVLKHYSKLVVITGHYDCAGNPAGEKEQKRQLSAAVELIEKWDLSIETIVGLWIDEKFEAIKNTEKKL